MKHFSDLGGSFEPVSERSMLKLSRVGSKSMEWVEISSDVVFKEKDQMFVKASL